MNIHNQTAADYLRHARNEMRKGNLDAAITFCTQVISLDPAPDPAYITDAHLDCGEAYLTKGKYGSAVDNFTLVIGRVTHHETAYYFRGLARLHLGNWDGARTDLDKARSLGVNLLGAFRHRYGGVKEFEARYRLHLPRDITAMLTPPSQLFEV